MTCCPMSSSASPSRTLWSQTTSPKSKPGSCGVSTYSSVSIKRAKQKVEVSILSYELSQPL
jgi:hypothetical protein